MAELPEYIMIGKVRHHFCTNCKRYIPMLPPPPSIHCGVHTCYNNPNMPKTVEEAGVYQDFVIDYGSENRKA